MLDWSTVASLATAAGTLVLAVATFASVRSGARSTRVAERALLVGLRPLLVPSRLDDPPQKVMFIDEKWLIAQGGGGAAEVGVGAIYLAMALRNVGSGIAVLHSWFVNPEAPTGTSVHADVADFRRLTRDLLIATGDVGFWQGAIRDRDDPQYAALEAVVTERSRFTIEVLYGDHEGGQRAITRFLMQPYQDRWLVSASRHWNLDRPDPR